MSNIYRVYEGRRYSPVFWAAVCEWRRLAQAEGIPFRITQGGFNRGGVSASAGTHDGDAIDLSVRGLTKAQVSRLVELGRMVGIAVWFRTTSTAKWGTRAHGFGSYHLHGVPNGWGYPSAGAARQATSYRAGRDGLARNLADLGPGHVGTYRTRTWAGYLKTIPSTPEGGISMSDANAILAVLSNENTGLPYVRKQLAAIDNKANGRARMNADAAATASIVERALAAQSKVILDAISKIGNLSAVDTAALQKAVADAVADGLKRNQ